MLWDGYVVAHRADDEACARTTLRTASGEAGSGRERWAEMVDRVVEDECLVEDVWRVDERAG